MRFYEPMKLPDSSIKTIHSRLDDILSSGDMVNGEYCRKLEDELHRHIDADYISVCSSGTRALEIAYRSLSSFHCCDFNFIVPAFTWKSLNYLPNVYVYNDAELDTWFVKDTLFFDEEVVIKHHTFGSKDNREFIGWVIQDAAQAFGCKFTDVDEATCFSLAPTKPFTTMNGGILATNSIMLNVIFIDLIDILGRLTEIQACVGLEYLKIFGRGLKHKQALAFTYKNNINGVRFQVIPDETTYNVFGILLKDSDIRYKVMVALLRRDIPTKQYYVPLSDTFIAKYIYDRILCLPIHSGVSIDKAKEISDIINEVTTSE